MMEMPAIDTMLKHPAKLSRHIQRALDETAGNDKPSANGSINIKTDSSVLFLLSQGCAGAPCLILNKRSARVKQPGDLCCPGGGVSAPWDHGLARILKLPRTPLTLWPFWKKWKTKRPERADTMALLLAAGLREGFEEMRLNPLRVRFLGALPAQRLIIFNRIIHPSVAWIHRQDRFHPNWEVEKIIYIPLRNLLDTRHYARYRLRYNMNNEIRQNGQSDDFPCFVHQNKEDTELLWGATYRITINFLRIVFGFQPPDMASLPVYHGSLEQAYMTGSGPVVSGDTTSPMGS